MTRAIALFLHLPLEGGGRQPERSEGWREGVIFLSHPTPGGGGGRPPPAPGGGGPGAGGPNF